MIYWIQERKRSEVPNEAREMKGVTDWYTREARFQTGIGVLLACVRGML